MTVPNPNRDASADQAVSAPHEELAESGNTAPQHEPAPSGNTAPQQEPAPSGNTAPQQEPAPSGNTAPQQELPPPTATPPADRMPRTRIGAAWVGICTAAVASVVLIVFMLQNTRSVKVTFLWMHGSVPLALALLVAAIGAAILTTAIGTARITQLRRQSRQRQ